MCDIWESCRNHLRDCDRCEENNRVKEPTGHYYEFNNWESEDD